jgi:hypothetical protein
MVPDVKVGQVWRSCDWRDTNSFKKVLSIDADGKATVIASNSKGTLTFARKSRIRLDRFKPGSTGYELVKDAQHTATEQQEATDE